MPSTNPPKQTINEKTIEEKIYAATRTAGPRPEFLEALGARLAEQSGLHSQPGPYRRLPGGRPFLEWLALPLRRPALAAAVVTVLVLAAALLAVGPQRVIAAVENLFSYLPGIGVVQNQPGLRVLAEPARVERDGISVTAEQGAADRQHTVIMYRVEGLSLKAANSGGEGGAAGGLAVLLLPDRTILTQTGASLSGWGTGYQARLEFPALPEGVRQAALLISRLEGMPAGAAPENWQIALHFKPAPPDLKLMPVFAFATPAGSQAAQENNAAQVATPAATPMAAPSGAGQEISPAISEGSSAAPSAAASAGGRLPGGLHFLLNQVIALEDGYQLQGSFTWTDPAVANVSFPSAGSAAYLLVDKNGQRIPVEEAVPEGPGSAPAAGSRPWAVRTNRKEYPGPWQLSAARLEVVRSIAPGQAAIQVDFGQGARPGQSWTLDQDLHAAGLQLRATSARLEANPRGDGLVLYLDFAGDPALSGVSVIDAQNLPGPGGAGGGGGPAAAEVAGNVRASIPYSQPPAGVRQIQVTSIAYFIDGPWTVQWDPPVSSAQPAPTQAAQACLTTGLWEQLKNQPSAGLPDGLAGRLLVEEPQPLPMPRLSLLSIDGTQRRELATGGWSALSPDGKTAAFVESSGSGLILLDIASGEKRTVPGTDAQDYHPVWSPDGSWLAFVRGLSGIYIVQPDGAGLRQVADESRVRFLAGWLPDGRSLVITSLTAEGSQVQTLDVQTGQIHDLFTIQNKKGGFVQLSPDGKRVAFAEMTFGLPSYGIYVASLDGSGKRLVAGLERGAAAAAAWSPDSTWLAVLVVEETSSGDEIERTVLIQPDTCQSWPAPGLNGKVSGWVR